MKRSFSMSKFLIAVALLIYILVCGTIVFGQEAITALPPDLVVDSIVFEPETLVSEEFGPSRGPAQASSAGPATDVFAAPVELAISGPDRVAAGTGRLLRLSARGVDTGAKVTWIPDGGFDRERHFLESNGLTFGCAVPCGPTTIRVQLISWSTEQWAFKTIVVATGPEPGPEPEPYPKPDKLVVFIIEETRDRGPDWGDVWNHLQRDSDLAKHSLSIIDDDTPGLLASYISKVSARPGIVIDDNWDPQVVLFTGPCPKTVTDIKALIGRFTKTSTAPAPEGVPTAGGDSATAPPKTPAAPDIPDFSEDVLAGAVAPTPQRRKPRYVWRTEADGTRWGVDTQTGTMVPVNESTRTFCFDGQCFRVPRR